MTTKYFKNVNTLAELKAEFRRLVLKNHPDMGGDTEVMKEINCEYDRLFPVYKLRYNQTATTPTHETAESDRVHFYTEHGWVGSNYRCGMRITEINTAIRAYVKSAYPDCKFSIRKGSYSSIEVTLVSGPYEAVNDGSEEHQVNQYYIDRDTVMTPWAKAVMTDVNDVIMSYRYDDSDAMTDYFDCNFYYSLHIGTWGKPYQVTAPKARRNTGNRISGQNTNANRRTA